MSNQQEIAPGDEDADAEVEAEADDGDALLTEPVEPAEPAEAPEDEHSELDDEAAADAAAAAEAGGVPAQARPAHPAKTAPRVVHLNPQARDGLIRCLQARIAHLDSTLAHAQEVAQKDAFYSRWPNVVGELRAQAIRRLEELQRS